MRIAYFNANLRVGQDGVTRVMYRMMEAARERGHEVMAFTSTLPDPGTTDIPMVRVPSVILPLQKNYRIALPGYRLFSSSLSRFKPDLLHINSPCTLGFSAMRFGREFGVPTVATYHTHFPTYPRYYHLSGLEELTWKLSRYLYNNVDRTFVPTRPILSELTEHDIRNLAYLPNGVDLKLFNPSFRSEAWRARYSPSNRPAVLFVSRLVWEKDLRILAGAYERLRRRRSDFEMIVVGDGHARREFEAMMPGAHFLGYQSGRSLSESYASSDIFAFPSTTETFGLVTLEAMASGAVPVAARIGGAAGIIEDGRSGLFARPLDAGDLARGIESLLDRPEYRHQLRHNALARAREFSWESILDQLFEHYADIRERHQRSAGRRAA